MAQCPPDQQLQRLLASQLNDREEMEEAHLRHSALPGLSKNGPSQPQKSYAGANPETRLDEFGHPTK